MYLDHFGLREAPFRITPHTEFFFFGASRGATLEALIYAITRDEGIVKVSGEVGSGKTMLCRMLLEKLPDNVDTVYLANPLLSRDEILHAIADELHAPLPESRPHQLLRALQERLIEIYAAGRQVVVMIDEAHAMPAETLEEIRLLSNLESNRHKLMHLVLFGQPELDTHLRQASMRPLKERITHNFALEPLRRSDIGSYLMFRMRAAGYHGPDLFTASAIERISKASEGLTRRINILADKALLAAFADNRHLIDKKQVNAAIRDAQFNALSTDWPRRRRWLAGATALLTVAAFGVFAGVASGWRWRDSAATDTQAAAPAAPVAEAGNDALAAIDDAPAADAAPAVAVAATEPAPEATATAAAPSDQAPAAPTLDARFAASEQWLSAAPGTHYVVQLLAVDSKRQREVEDFLARRAPSLDAQQLRVYRSNLSGRDRIGIVYGDYPSHATASADLQRLARICGGTPYVRSINKLR